MRSGAARLTRRDGILLAGVYEANRIKPTYSPNDKSQSIRSCSVAITHLKIAEG